MARPDRSVGSPLFPTGWNAWNAWMNESILTLNPLFQDLSGISNHRLFSGGHGKMLRQQDLKIDMTFSVP
jgi:hypothetical protein